MIDETTMNSRNEDMRRVLAARQPGLPELTDEVMPGSRAHGGVVRRYAGPSTRDGVLPLENSAAVARDFEVWLAIDAPQLVAARLPRLVASTITGKFMWLLDAVPCTSESNSEDK